MRRRLRKPPRRRSAATRRAPPQPNPAAAPPGRAGRAPATAAARPPQLAGSQNMSTVRTQDTPPQSGDASALAIARQMLARMSLEQRVGQVFMLGFEGTTLTAA